MPDEILLIKRLQNKDTRALSSLYDSYSGALYGVIIRMCKDEAKAQDLLQETFLQIWQRADQYDPNKGRFYTWAYRIARNKTLNFLRNSRDLIQNEDLSVYEDKEQEETPEAVSQLSGALKQLEAHHQQALELVYFQGLTHREAHEAMDVPLGTFKSYVRQALNKLRESYQQPLVILWTLIECIR